MKSIMKTIQTENGIQTIIKQKGEYTLLAKHHADGSFHEYVVCLDYRENGSWWHGNYFGNDLLGAVECFEVKTNPNYISRDRLEEIATFALEIMVDEEIYLELNPNEIKFFGLEEDGMYADKIAYECDGEKPWWL